jgi:hypothetical protein
MISRLLEGAVNFVVYASAATMMATVIMVCYLWTTWHMDRGRLIQMLAIAQGLDLFQAQAEDEAKEREPSAEQPSMQQIIDARLSKDRDLTMREMALQNGNEQLRMELRRLIEQRAAYDRLMKDFQTQLAQVQEGAEAEGRTTVAATLQTLEPEQAKLLLLDMLDKQETEEVVILLIGMDERRRAGILGEFQTPDEIAKIAEVLRLIRQGHPKAAIAEEVSQRVDPQNLGTK